MKFKAGQRRKAIEYEKDLVKYWKEHKTFEKSVEQRPTDNAYVFYDGPPFITGVPHHGTLLSSVVKDAVPRYWTMQGKIYEGKKVLLYCVRDATPISKAEVAMDNSYQDVTDPSVYVKFKLKDRDAYLLAWTTTPWTLPGNTAVGVGEEQIYTEVEVEN